MIINFITTTFYLLISGIKLLFTKFSYIDLQDYDISEDFGFMSNVYMLPSKFDIFDTIIKAMDDTNITGIEFREIVNEFCDNEEYTDEYFNTITDNLSYNDLKSIYCVFGFICQKYERCCGIDNLLRVIPYRIGIIWHNSSLKLGLETVPTYSSLILYNWRWQNNTISPIFNLSLTPDEAHFYNIHQRIEFAGVKLINKTVELINFGHNINFMYEYLNILNETFIDITKILRDMKTSCNSNTFFNIIRNYITGYNNTEYYPNGISIENTDINFKYSGGSGAQSPIMALIEVLFKINYNDDHITKFMKNSLNSISEKHRNFINIVSNKITTIKELVLQYNDNNLNELYDTVNNNFAEFRSRHIKIVGVYVHRFIADNNVHTMAGRVGTSNLVSNVDNDDYVNVNSDTYLLENESPLMNFLNIIYIATRNNKINT